MAKGKDKAGGSKKEEQTNYDPSILHNTYVQACNSIGIKPYGFDTNDSGEQIIITGSSKKENDRLSSGGCRALMKALSGKLVRGDVLSTVEPFTSLKDLRIRSSNIQDTGALAVATFLRATAEVKTPKEASEEKATTAQPQWKLQYLDLSDNVIGHQGALQIGRSLEVGMNKTLSTLILDFNPLGSAGALSLCKGISTNSSLKVLSIRHCDITNSTEGDEPIFCAMLSFKRLALATLDLSSNRLEGKGLKEQLCSGLEQNSSLTTLRLADNNIRQTDEDVAALEEFGKVLSRNSTLTDIDLNNNLIGSKGGKCLLHYVSENKHITTFKVSEIGMDTETYTALFRVSNVAKGKGKKKGKKKSSKKK